MWALLTVWRMFLLSRGGWQPQLPSPLRLLVSLLPLKCVMTLVQRSMMDVRCILYVFLHHFLTDQRSWQLLKLLKSRAQ